MDADRELSAYNFYKKLADIHPEGEVSAFLTRMAQEELKHKGKI